MLINRSSLEFVRHGYVFSTSCLISHFWCTEKTYLNYDVQAALYIYPGQILSWAKWLQVRIQTKITAFGQSGFLTVQ